MYSQPNATFSTNNVNFGDVTLNSTSEITVNITTTSISYVYLFYSWTLTPNIGINSCELNGATFFEIINSKTVIRNDDPGYLQIRFSPRNYEIEVPLVTSGYACIMESGAKTYNATLSFNYGGIVNITGRGVSSTSIQLPLQDEEEWTLYPNPAKDFISFTKSGKINIVNALGEVVLSRDVTRADELISISHLDKGIYMVYSEHSTPKKLIIR